LLELCVSVDELIPGQKLTRDHKPYGLSISTIRENHIITEEDIEKLKKIEDNLVARDLPIVNFYVTEEVVETEEENPYLARLNQRLELLEEVRSDFLEFCNEFYEHVNQMLLEAYVDGDIQSRAFEEHDDYGSFLETIASEQPVDLINKVSNAVNQAGDLIHLIKIECNGLQDLSAYTLSILENCLRMADMLGISQEKKITLGKACIYGNLGTIPVRVRYEDWSGTEDGIKMMKTHPEISTSVLVDDVGSLIDGIDDEVIEIISEHEKGMEEKSRKRLRKSGRGYDLSDIVYLMDTIAISTVEKQNPESLASRKNKKGVFAPLISNAINGRGPNKYVLERYLDSVPYHYPPGLNILIAEIKNPNKIILRGRIRKIGRNGQPIIVQSKVSTNHTLAPYDLASLPNRSLYFILIDRDQERGA